MAKHGDDDTKKGPTPQQKGAALYAALREMVRHAEETGQRDEPHVVKAREALVMCEEV